MRPGAMAPIRLGMMVPGVPESGRSTFRETGPSRVHTTTSMRAIACVAAAGWVLSGCSIVDTPEIASEGTEQSADVLRIATLLPQSGPLAYLAPGPRAATALAVSDINDAGGVLDHDIEVVVNANEGATSEPTVNAEGVDDVLAARPAFVLGAVSSAMTHAAMPRLTDAGVLMGSPSNTGDALTGVNDLYFRTAPPDALQGRALGSLIAQDGAESVAILAADDDAAAPFRDALEAVLGEQSVDVVFGADDSGEDVPTDQTMFASEVAAVDAADADAVVVLANEQTPQLISELADRDVDLSNLYFRDVNTVDFSSGADGEEFESGLLSGAQGVIPGARADDTFRERLASAFDASDGGELEVFNYAPESYDAIVLVALAAERGGAADSGTIVEHLAAVSGADGGEECATYAECLALLAADADIHYTGQAGIGPITEDGDPSTALIGVYEYDDANVPVYARSIEG